jgi:hypothetical protein
MAHIVWGTKYRYHMLTVNVSETVEQEYLDHHRHLSNQTSDTFISE